MFNRVPSVVVEVRIRLGSSIAKFAPAPTLTMELPTGATVGQLYELLASSNPNLAPALRSALPILGGAHVPRDQALTDGDEVALLAPVSGG
jgi:molybdopterin converting factor small subunit